MLGLTVRKSSWISFYLFSYFDEVISIKSNYALVACRHTLIVSISIVNDSEISSSLSPVFAIKSELHGSVLLNHILFAFRMDDNWRKNTMYQWVICMDSIWLKFCKTVCFVAQMVYLAADRSICSLLCLYVSFLTIHRMHLSQFVQSLFSSHPLVNIQYIAVYLWMAIFQCIAS